MNKNISTSFRIHKIEEYYFSKKLREIAQMNLEGKQVINLGIGSPDLPPHSSIIQALNKNAVNKKNHAYQNYKGIPELRIAFSHWYQKYFGVQLSPENEILPLMGSKEGIMHISMSFLNANDEVLIPNPGYPAYAAATKMAGGKIIEYDLKEKNNWLPNLKKLKKKDLKNVKLMWINYPHMPTGSLATISFFKQLIQLAQKNNFLIINDNPYSFILNKKPLSILKIKNAKEYCLELNSLSKSHNMAGWRIGMLGGKKEYIDAVLRFKSNMDSGMFKPIQFAAIQALQVKPKCYKKLNSIYKKRQKISNYGYFKLYLFEKTTRAFCLGKNSKSL